MKAAELITQLRNQLLLFTNLFSDEIKITHLVRNGNVATATTESSHGFINDQSVTVTGAFYRNTIVSISQSGRTVSVITQDIHNLTEIFTKTVTIEGADDPNVNGDFNLVKVTGDKSFEYQIDRGVVLNFSGDMFLKDEFTFESFNGRHKIDVISPTKFTFPIGDMGPSVATGDISVRYNPRISGALSNQRAIDSYTAKKTNEIWAYVVLGSSFVSKSRHIDSDSTDYLGTGSSYRQRTINDFTVLVFLPIKNEISGRAARDLAQDIEVYLAKSLLLYFPNNRFFEKVLSGIICTGNIVLSDNVSFYVHSYSYESTQDIVFEDTRNIESVSMRTIDIEYRNDNDNIIMSTDNISLYEDL